MSVARAAGRRGPLHGALAAAVTPLSRDGDAVDIDAVASLAAFYAGAGLDGVLVLGTTGEGVLFDVDERIRVAEAYIAACGGRFAVAVHCGAQSTRDTVALAEHAAAAGAPAVAVIPPPYFALDHTALLGHLTAAARACAPTPFYVYEFAARSGYAVPVALLEELRASAANAVGMKVSDTPFEHVAPYLVEGVDVLVGAEALIERGLDAGAVGAVSGLAAALPELTVDAVRTASAAASARAGAVRAALDRFPFHAALKHVLRWRGVSIEATVRAPLRPLSATELGALDALVHDPMGEIAPLLNR